MSGALLQTAGQVRNSFPFIVRKSIGVNVSLIDTTPVVLPVSQSRFTDTVDIPFDYGPDKSGRVYIILSNICISVTSGIYDAAGILVGHLYYQDPFGNEYVLWALGDTMPNARAFNNNAVIGAYAPLFSNKPEFLGAIVWRNNGTVIATLTTVIARVVFNIGYYGDYAEYNFDSMKQCVHHHYHGVAGDEVVDTTKV